MTVACYLDASRPKADRWMRAFAAGCKGRVIRGGERDPDADDHAVMGNWPVASKLIAEFKQNGTPFWYLDSGYIQATGRRDLRVERSRFWPEFGERHTMDRALAMGVRLDPWRHDGRHVLICLQGHKFGRPWDIDIAEWHATIESRVRAATDRPIIVRPKPYSPEALRAAPPLMQQLEDAWCLVTHSSTVAVTAALAGVPVFCAQTCAAAPVGCTDLARIETPERPDREVWVAALAWRQFSQSEMRSGMAWEHLNA